MTTSELQALFDAFVEEALAEDCDEDDDEYDNTATINLTQFVDHCKSQGHDPGEVDGYDTPIFGLKDFDSLCGDNPHEIEEDGYDEFIVSG